jgi:cytochrome b pre-mRNA-processing protein 3
MDAKLKCFLEVGLKPTFSVWSQVTMLHMYLLSARFRDLKDVDPQPWQQHLLDHFFYDAEHRMATNHNMHARGTRNKYLKDLFVQWRGLLAAYDEGISKGDAVLAAAVWRNVFKGVEDVDITKLALIVSYLRRLLKGLDGVSDHDLMTNVVGFGSPKAEEGLVRIKSPSLDLSFDKTPGTHSPKEKGAKK